MQTFRRLERHLGMVPAAILRQLSEIDIARGRQEAFRIQNPAVLVALTEIALVQSVEASNAIEQITAPRKRIEALVAKKTTPANRSEEEIAGYRDVLNTIHTSAESIPFTPTVLEQLHRDLYRFTPVRAGRFKDVDNTVTETLPDGRVVARFEPVSAFQTPGAMAELHDRCNEAWDADKYHRLLLTGAYILDFLVIHPFRDGNGRMSRLIALLLLYKAGYEAGRFISLEKLIDETRESYYEALGASTARWHEGEHDLRPWLSYFLGILIAAYKQFEERVGAVTGRGSKAELIRQLVRSGVSDVFSFGELKRAAPGISDPYLRQVLRDLKAQGVIEPVGFGRGARWRRLHTSF